MSSKELLRRIDERNYLTEREHREFLEELNKDLEQKELLEIELKLEKDKVKYLMKQLKKQDEILSILKPYFRGAVFPSAINFNFSDKNWKPIKEWLDNGNK